MKETLEEKFIAFDNAGHKITILVYQSYVNVATRDNPNGRKKGYKRLVSDENREMIAIDANTFKFLDTNEIDTKA